MAEMTKSQTLEPDMGNTGVGSLCNNFNPCVCCTDFYFVRRVKEMKVNSKTRHEKLVKLTVCAVMLALATVLSFIQVWKMPMGGSVTLLSMLPIALVSLKYGVLGALPTAFLYSVIQLALGFAGGIFTYCTTAETFIICLLFDYIVPFSLLAVSGIFKKSKNAAIMTLGVVIAVILRFACHYVTGVVIWGQWADGTSPYLYSLIYNGQYMLPECIFTSAAAAVLLKIPQVRKMLAPTN